MIGTITVKYNARHPNFPLQPLFSFVGSPSAVKVVDVPKKIGLWQITKVYVRVTYPDNTIHSADCTFGEGAYVATLPACQAVGKSPDGYSVFADGVDENGQAVTGYVLGKGDCTILDTDFEVKNGEHTYYVHYQEVVPENPHKGDVTGFADGFRMYDGNRWREFVEVIDYNRLENKPKINGVTLLGDRDAEDLGLAEKSELSAYALSSLVSAEYTSLELFNQTLGNLESIISGI